MEVNELVNLMGARVLRVIDEVTRMGIVEPLDLLEAIGNQCFVEGYEVAGGVWPNTNGVEQTWL